MSLFGAVPNFDHRKNDWSIFIDQLENFFIANDIDETRAEKKKAILVTSLSEESHKLARNLLQPLDISSTTYDQLTEVLNKHFKPTQSCFSERAKFYYASKDPKESIQEWAAKLRSLAANCDFESHLSIALRDKFMMGLPKGPIKEKLFQEDEKSLTFDKALEIALNIECIKSHYEGEKRGRKPKPPTEDKPTKPRKSGEDKARPAKQPSKPKKEQS